MNARPSTLPLSTTPAFTPRGHGQALAGAAWSRAFAEAAVGRAGGDAAPSAAGARPVQILRGELATGAAPREPACGQAPAVRQRTAAPVPGVATPASIALAQQLVDRLPASACVPAGCIQADRQLPDADPAPAARATRAPCELPAPRQAPVRVHLEQQDEGLAVWLGVDAAALRACQGVPALVASLLARFAASQPVVAIVCNGSTVHSRPRSSKENP